MASASTTCSNLLTHRLLLFKKQYGFRSHRDEEEPGPPSANLLRLRTVWNDSCLILR
jgi:hypothetical protein